MMSDAFSVARKAFLSIFYRIAWVSLNIFYKKLIRNHLNTQIIFRRSGSFSFEESVKPLCFGGDLRAKNCVEMEGYL